jgi:hypothetical protein
VSSQMQIIPAYSLTPQQGQPSLSRWSPHSTGASSSFTRCSECDWPSRWFGPTIDAFAETVEAAQSSRARQ